MVYLVVILLCLLTFNCGRDPAFIETEESSSENFSKSGNSEDLIADLLPDGEGESLPGDGLIFDPGSPQAPGDDDLADPPAPQDPENPNDPGNPEKPADPEYESYSKKFQVAYESKHTATVSYEAEQYEQNLTLTSDIEEKRIGFQQVERPRHLEQMRQGQPIDAFSEVFNQQESGVLDILIVVDNSGSMKEEQEKLAERMMPLLSAVSQANWNIGVTTTDPKHRCLRGLIAKGDSDAEEKFSRAIQAGVDGTGNERGILMAANGIKDNCQSPSWPRTGSTLAIVLLTDEDNCSSNSEGCANAPDASPDFLYDILADDLGRRIGDDARVYGIFWHPDMPRSQCQSADNQAYVYSKLIDDTGGVWGNICDADYTDTLKVISENIADTLKDQFELMQNPNPESLIVRINGRQLQQGYSLQGQTLVFDEKPASLSRIEVDYEVGSNTMTKEFKLQHPPKLETMNVKVNGAIVGRSGYEILADSKTIVFGDFPEARARIEVEYKEDMALPSRFQLEAVEHEDEVLAFINGTQVTEFQYDAATDVISFARPPAELANILVVINSFTAPVYSYPFAPQAEPLRVDLFDVESDQPVAFTLDGSMLTVAANEFRHGRKLQLVYRVASSEPFTYWLTHEPLADSLVVASGELHCDEANGMQRIGDLLDLTDCGFGYDEAVSVNYNYLGAKSVFKIDAGEVRIPVDAQFWQVSWNGRAVAFTRNGFEVTVTEDLTPEGEVTVAITAR